MSQSNTDEPSVALDRLAGLVERVTFHNEENGYCVLRLNVKGERDLVTLVGHSPAVAPGEYASASGHWVTDREHGRQFRAVFVKISAPTTLTGIERYLGSGMVKGIGPVYAGKLVQAFGAAVFDVIEQTPERLREIAGIGDVRSKKITSGWADQKVVRSIMVFLHAHGVSTSKAVRIFKTYGQNAIDTVSANPYRLAKDIRGIGFLSADTIAQKIGIAKDSPMRAQAGVSYALAEASGQGHCGLPYDELVGLAIKLLGIEQPVIEEAIAQELEDKVLYPDTVEERPCVFLAPPRLSHKNFTRKSIDSKWPGTSLNLSMAALKFFGEVFRINSMARPRNDPMIWAWLPAFVLTLSSPKVTSRTQLLDSTPQCFRMACANSLTTGLALDGCGTVLLT